MLRIANAAGVGLCSGFGRDVRDLMVGYLGQTRQDVFQVSVRIEAAAGSFR
jgi:hypothetical protein